MTIQFVLFLIAQAISEFGGAASAAGLAVLWALRGSPAAELALVLALPALPALLLAPVIGSLMEGARLKRALLAINILLGLTSLGMAASIGLPQGDALVALTVLFSLKAIGQIAFNGAYNRAYGQLAPLGGLTGRPRALQTLSHQGGKALGAAAGTLLATVAGSSVFIVDAATFGVAALIVAGLPLATRAALGAGHSVQTPMGIFRDVADAVRYVAGDARRTRVFALFAALTTCYATWDVLGAYLCKELGAESALAPITIAAQVGEMAMAAAILFTDLPPLVGLVMGATTLLAAATVASGLVVMGHGTLGIFATISIVCAFRVVTGAAASYGGGGAYTLAILSGPPGLTSRLTALVESVGLGLFFAAAKLGVGTLGDAIGASATFVVAGATAGSLGFGLAVLEARARARETVERRLRLLVLSTLQAGEGNVVAAYRYYAEHIQ